LALNENSGDADASKATHKRRCTMVTDATMFDGVRATLASLERMLLKRRLQSRVDGNADVVDRL